MPYYMDMEIDPRAQGIIEGAEKAIAALAAEAMAKLDYPKANSLSALAQRVGNTLRITAKPDGQGVGGPGNSPQQAKAHESAANSTGKRVPPGQYPRFKKEDDTLVKIGWSKSDRATYEHRSPRDILDRLVTRIVEVGSSGERFTTEQILPLLDERNNELPSYQVYLCLAWLVMAGLLERHGRQGYTVAANTDLRDTVEAKWKELPHR
jgi:hypothetical protein